jgi:disease resistance protein RPM1
MAPVISAALGAFGPLLAKITSFLGAECGRLKGVRREIRSLQSELVIMHGALKRYTELDDPDDQVKEWISLVRELAYDTEDCFDDFIHRLGKGGQHTGFKEFIRKTAWCLKTLGARRGIAGQIDDLKLRIKEVKDLKISYRVDDIGCSTSHEAVADPRLSARFVKEAHLVAIEEPRDQLANWMVEEEENKKHLRVLSIVGSGGLGKTTLTNEIYRKIQGHFECRAFVSVSQNPNLKKIIKDVIYQVPYPDEFTAGMDTWDDVTSIAKLRELLQDKR